MDGGKVKVFVLRELVISWSHERPESDALVGLDILDEVIWEIERVRNNPVSVDEG